MPTNNPALTNAIRRAVASGEFLRVTSLWSQYASLLRDEILHGTCTRAHMEEARELLDWSRRSTALRRAHVQSRLDALRVAAQYQQQSPPAPSLVGTCL